MPMTPAQQLGFFSRFNLQSLQARPHRVPYQRRNSAAYLVDFTAPTARYTAKFVACVASQIRRAPSGGLAKERPKVTATGSLGTLLAVSSTIPRTIYRWVRPADAAGVFAFDGRTR
jgi:hypothetical protein